MLNIIPPLRPSTKRQAASRFSRQAPDRQQPSGKPSTSLNLRKIHQTLPQKTKEEDVTEQLCELLSLDPPPQPLFNKEKLFKPKTFVNWALNAFLVHITENGLSNETLRLIAPAIVNARNSNGWTPLTIAIRNYGPGVAIALSKIPGIDVNKPDSSGLTPLIIAIQYNPGVIEALSKIPGIDVNKPGPSGLTPLRIAIINKSFRAQSALLVAGAKE